MLQSLDWVFRACLVAQFSGRMHREIAAQSPTEQFADITTIKPVEGEFVVGFYREIVTDFMFRNGLQYLDSRLTTLCDPPATAHAQLANTCIRYLSTYGIIHEVTSKGQAQKTLFLDYVARHWCSHAVEAEKRGLGKRLRWPSQSTLDIWVHICSLLNMPSVDRPQNGITLMHVAARHGLEGLAKEICRKTTQKPNVRTEMIPSTHRGMDSNSSISLGYATRNDDIHSADPESLGRQCESEEMPRPKREPSNSGGGPTNRARHTTTRGAKPQQDRKNRIRSAPITIGYSEDRDDKIDVKDGIGQSPLHVAAQYGNLGIVRLFHEFGCEFTTKDRYGCTASYLASSNGHLSVIQFLHDHMPIEDIHTATEDGSTPVYAASNGGHLEALKFLCHHGSNGDIHSARKDGGTPIYAASLNGYLDVVQFLFNHGAGSDIHTATKKGVLPINAAAFNASLEVVKFLYDHGAEPDICPTADHQMTSILAACCNGQLEVVKFLCDQGADRHIHTATDDGCTPLFAASKNGHLEVVKFLYEHGAESDIHTATNNGVTPINAASDNDHLEIVKLLRARGRQERPHSKRR